MRTPRSSSAAVFVPNCGILVLGGKNHQFSSLDKVELLILRRISGPNAYHWMETSSESYQVLRWIGWTRNHFVYRWVWWALSSCRYQSAIHHLIPAIQLRIPNFILGLALSLLLVTYMHISKDDLLIGIKLNARLLGQAPWRVSTRTPPTFSI